MNWFRSQKRSDSNRRHAAIDMDMERARRELTEAEEELCEAAAAHTREVVGIRSTLPPPPSGVTLLEELA